ncbi:hypothetical protein OSTOST_25640 [Ostertagia ostertagi]
MHAMSRAVYTPSPIWLHQEIFELGCNYEQCRDDFGGIGEAVFTCVYNKKAPKKTDLYQKGGQNRLCERG